MSQAIQKIDKFDHFSARQQSLYQLLDQLGIVSETYSHPPIFTVDEGHALALHHHIPGQGGKSLLLTNKNDELWLVVACEHTRVNLKTLSDRLETKRFSFAKPEIMLEVMGVTPGSATPFALMNDTHKQLRIVLDEEFLKTEQCVFHPLQNDHSTVLAVKDLMAFMTHLGYSARILPLA